ncbi:glycosyl transferase family protein [sediment metagenome]|uniref:Glycosyl transferase family protein n=1 Tax=sediment metagenome TaxID=749907 RepID=D9PJX9_9ZZZZ
MNPTVTVVIPTLNRCEMLRDAIGSVCAQDYPIHELIVVDDGSTESLEPALVGHPLVPTVVRHSTNRGHSAARNSGIAAATGDLIAFLDSDDRWLPRKLSLQVPYFAADPDVGLVGGGIQYIDSLGAFIKEPRTEDEIVTYRDMALDLFLSGSSTTAIVRAEVFGRVGIFDESLPLLEDWDMWLRISRHYGVRNVQSPVAQVRWHQELRAHRPEPERFARVTEEVRARINATIINGCLRRRAEALTHFHLSRFWWRAGRRATALGFLARSLVTWPFRIHRYRPRLRAIIGLATGRW